MILSGDAVVKKIRDDIDQRLSIVKDKDIKPVLGLVMVGRTEENDAYYKIIQKQCDEHGIVIKLFDFDNDIRQVKLIDCMESLNRDDNIQGVKMFTPLPPHINDYEVRNVLVPSKDLEGMTDRSMAATVSGQYVGYPPCMAEATLIMLKHYDIPIAGKNIVVMGKHLAACQPISMLLTANRGTVTLTNDETKREDLRRYCENADIVVAATGVHRSFGADLAFPRQTVIDVGIDYEEESIGSNVAFDAVKDKVANITPVPGGISDVMTAVLLDHMAQAVETDLKNRPGYNL